MDSAVPLSIPGGRRIDGARINHGTLRPLVGADEVALAGSLGRVPPTILATSVLARCVVELGSAPFDHEAACDLTVGDREALLWQLRRATIGDDLEAVVSCESCAEKSAIGLTVGALLHRPYQNWSQTWTETFGDHRVLFRLPTGRDQENLVTQPTSSVDLAGATERLLEFCVLEVDGQPPEPYSLEAIGAELGEHLARLDPQAEALIQATCPGCDRPLTAELDAATFLFEEISAGARYLLNEVHLIASVYHWAEEDILAMPAERRRAYAELIGAPLGGGESWPAT